MKNPLSYIALGLIYMYRFLLSPIFGRTCRFYPTCSSYALDAYKSYGFLTATGLVLRRLCKCRPGGGNGIDFLSEDIDKQQKKDI